MRVLIVEDDSLSRLITEAAVAKFGHTAVSTADGAQAWQLLQQDQFDAIVCDRKMPIMDGIELCQRVRAQRSTQYPYFIFLTALTEKNSIAEGMEAGADDYLVKPFKPDELAARLGVAERISDLHSRLAAQQAELELLNAKLFEQARVDPLTGVSTRLRLNEDLEDLSARVERYSERYCAVMSDVDHFKQYNDAYGHPAGDAVLRKVADTLAENLRAGDQVYRYGGEEFLLILRADSIEAGVAGAERHRAAIEALKIPHRGSPFDTLTISMGASLLSAGGSDAITMWLCAADAALYRAKSLGRNQVAAERDQP